MSTTRPRSDVDLRALRLPAVDAPMWDLVERMRGGETMSLAENLQIVSGLAFPASPEVLNVVAQALAEVEARHLIVGGFAVGALTARPRATVDIDIMIAREDAGPFEEALARRLGPLEIERYRSLDRIKRPAIDLIMSDPTALRRESLRAEHGQDVELAGVVVRLPVPELAVVLKYASMVSRSRSADDARQDLADLGRLLTNNPALDDALLARLAKTLHTRSPKELPRIIATLRAGGDIGMSRAGSRVMVTFIDP